MNFHEWKHPFLTGRAIRKGVQSHVLKPPPPLYYSLTQKKCSNAMLLKLLFNEQWLLLQQNFLLTSENSCIHWEKIGVQDLHCIGVL